MSAKNFVSYGDAETLFTEAGGELKKRTKQLSTMPTPSADHLGEIVQYIGSDTVTSPFYKKCKFYECIAQGSSYKWNNVDFVRKVGHAIYSEAWGGTDSKSELIETLNAFHEDFMGAIEDCDISVNTALYSCYVNTPYEGMPTNTQIKAYYDSDAGWVYRAYSSFTAEDFVIIPTGEAPNITDITVTKLGGVKYYLHEISFELKSMKEIIDEDTVTQALRNNNTAMAIGIHKKSTNGNWEEWIVDGTSSSGGYGLIGNLKNGTSSYTQDSSRNRIRFTVLSPVSSQITSLYALHTYCINKKIVPGTNMTSYSYAADIAKLGDFEGFNSNSMIVIHYKPEISGYFDDYIKKFTLNKQDETNKDEEGILMLWNTQIKNWTDTVTEWTA